MSQQYKFDVARPVRCNVWPTSVCKPSVAPLHDLLPAIVRFFRIWCSCMRFAPTVPACLLAGVAAQRMPHAHLYFYSMAFPLFLYSRGGQVLISLADCSDGGYVVVCASLSRP